MSIKPVVLHPEMEADIRGFSPEARRVMAIGNAPPGPTGLVGYYARRFPDNRQILIKAMNKVKSAI